MSNTTSNHQDDQDLTSPLRDLISQLADGNFPTIDNLESIIDDVLSDETTDNADAPSDDLWTVTMYDDDVHTFGQAAAAVHTATNLNVEIAADIAVRVSDSGSFPVATTTYYNAVAVEEHLRHAGFRAGTTQASA